MGACAACGQVNPEIARFCLACGMPVEPAAGPAGEERKTVTVLFCDLVGFTAASDHADPEDVRARIRPYHARLRREIEGFGGTVEKFIGDAVMAVFGAPVTHEDDPERAARAGLRILEAITDLNQADPGLGLAVRVGVETGEAVLTTSPVASPSPSSGAAPSAITASPVSTPTRTASPSPGSASFRSAIASKIRSPARTARSGSSSWATGAPKTAITASPMNFSTVPPNPSTSRRSRAW